MDAGSCSPSSGIGFGSTAAHAATQVCVSVEQKSWYRPVLLSPPPTPAPAPEAPKDPWNGPRGRSDRLPDAHAGARGHARDRDSPPWPTRASSACVELYQLESGWTVFARYTEREEKVNHAELDEFSSWRNGWPSRCCATARWAVHHARERAAVRQRAKPADGRGHRHFIFGMGTEARLARCRRRRVSRCRSPTSCAF